MRLGIISDTHGQVELTRPAVRMFESLDRAAPPDDGRRIFTPAMTTADIRIAMTPAATCWAA